MKIDGGPAYPVIGAPGASQDYQGMSLRDYFAGQALAGLIIVSGGSDEGTQAMSELTKESGKNTAQIIASGCYAYADTMIAERVKP